MKLFAVYVWAFLVSIVRATAVLIQICIAIILFLAAIAQIASFGLDHGNIVIESLRNIAGWIALPQTVSQQDLPAKRCAQYEKRVMDLHCRDEKEPRKRMLCQVTVPPVELVCVD